MWKQKSLQDRPNYASREAKRTGPPKKSSSIVPRSRNEDSRTVVGSMAVEIASCPAMEDRQSDGSERIAVRSRVGDRRRKKIT
jgi:hypothetical protein